MACRTALLCFFAAMLAAGCNRTDSPPKAPETIALNATEPAGEHPKVDAFAAPGGIDPKGDALAKPVPLEVDGKRLTSDVYSFVPFVGDLDGDGLPDLLLGTREKGRLLVYRNVGTKTSPRLTEPQWFDDTVPTGRIPDG